MIDRTLSVAPMMDWTDRHCRYFHRLLTPNALLYTEMVTAAAIVHGDSQFLLGHHSAEHPLALQIGGSDPVQIGKACKIAQQFAYEEVNLNVGCPSDRVQSGSFGAVLMEQPERVADCVKAMQDNSQAEITVKTRLGIDDQDSYEFLQIFINKVAATGCKTFIVHARKAWLQGLSPKQNREIPELDYQRVYQLKKDFPDLEIVINGGISSIEDVQQHLQQVDGVMLGRVAYQKPYMLSEIDSALFSDGEDHDEISYAEIVRQFYPYIEERLSEGLKLSTMTRHMLGLFQNCPGAKMWRRHISENAYKIGADLEVLETALQFVE